MKKNYIRSGIMALVLCVLGVTIMLAIYSFHTNMNMMEARDGKVYFDNLRYTKTSYQIVGDWTPIQENGVDGYEVNLTITNPYNYSIYFPKANNYYIMINGSYFKAYPPLEYVVYSIRHVGSTEETFNIKVFVDNSEQFPKENIYMFVGKTPNAFFISNMPVIQRLFTVGISLMALIYAISLYLRKPSEKYLIPFALLVYSTFGRTFTHAFNMIRNVPVLNFLLFGTVEIPGLTYNQSFNLNTWVLGTLVAILTYQINANFINCKVTKKQIPYIFIVLAVQVPHLFMIMDLKLFYEYRIITYVVVYALELWVIARGINENKYASLVLGGAWIFTTSFRFTKFACELNMFPHGIFDLFLRLDGTIVTFYVFSYMILVNTKFAQKFKESEILANNLEEKVEERMAQLEKAMEEQQRIQHEKDIFVRGIVHNLKTPLFAISGYTDMAKDSLTTSPQDTEHFLDLINDRADNTKDMVESLLLSVKLQEGHVKYNMEVCDLNMIVERVNTASRIEALKYSVCFNYLLHFDHAYIYADAIYIQQAIQNIVDNAIQHSYENGNVVLEVEEGKENYIISVTDTGEGIAEENLDKIFDLYYSRHASKKTSSGIGLTNAKKIIDVHHGTIEVHSKEGEGTTFIVTLPKYKETNKASNSN